METLRSDCAFLTKLNVMDYSLLLGIHDIEKGEMEEEAEARADPDTQQDEDTGGEVCLKSLSFVVLLNFRC